MEVLTPWTGEMLVLAMLVVLNARIFFTRHTRIDSLSILGPLSLITTFLQMLAWGLRITNIVILALSLISSILNYRSLVRFSQQLFVDTYSLKFFVSSILLLAVTVALTAFSFMARPVRLQTHRYNVDVSRKYYSCAFSAQNQADAEVHPSKEITDKRNLTLYTFSNRQKERQKDTVILFVPDVQAEALQYEPYLILLARNGYTVLAADLYSHKINSARGIAGTKFLRRFLIMQTAYSAKKLFPTKDRNSFLARRNSFMAVYQNTYKALASIARTEYPEKNIFFVSDASSFLPKNRVHKIMSTEFAQFDARATPRFLDLSTIGEYTMPGFGFLAETDPVFSRLIFGIKKDKTLFEPSYCTMKTMEALK